MKKILLFSAMFCGFAVISTAQTTPITPATPSTVVGTEIKKDAASAEQGSVATTETPKQEEAVVKKECSKKEGKGCCKASAAAGTSKADCQKKCEGEKKAAGCESGAKGAKGCCKKKAADKTGS